MKDYSLIRNPSGPSGQLCWTETLRDGSQVLIRPLMSSDREAERAFIEGLSPESRHYRFLCTLRHPSEVLLDTLTNVDQTHNVAFAAVVSEGTGERIVGVSRYTTDHEPQHAECAVTVADDWQDKGLGSTLMRHLIDIAKAHGVTQLYSRDSAENMRMRDLAGYLGFQTRTDPADASQVIHELVL